MSPVAVAADKRFHRAHVKPSRRRAHWRGVAGPVLKFTLVAAVVLFAGFRGRAMVADAAVLRVDRVVVHGNDRLTETDVSALLDGLPGQNLIWTDLEAWRRQLLASPWIREASLRRTLPSTIEVVVAERQPIGIARLAGALYLVDERGSVIDRYGPAYAELDLPIIDGLSAVTAKAAKTGAEMPAGVDARAHLAGRLLSALRTRPDVAKRVSQIDVRDLHNAAVILNGDPAVIYVGEDRFLPRLESYLELADAVREKVADIDYVDLRFDERIYVRPVQAKRR
jgi:cell division septal protein FtsQ